MDLRNNEKKLPCDLAKDPEVAALLREAGGMCVCVCVWMREIKGGEGGKRDKKREGGGIEKKRKRETRREGREEKGEEKGKEG